MNNWIIFEYKKNGKLGSFYNVVWAEIKIFYVKK